MRFLDVEIPEWLREKMCQRYGELNHHATEKLLVFLLEDFLERYDKSSVSVEPFKMNTELLYKRIEDMQMAVHKVNSNAAKEIEKLQEDVRTANHVAIKQIQIRDKEIADVLRELYRLNEKGKGHSLSQLIEETCAKWNIKLNEEPLGKVIDKAYPKLGFEYVMNTETGYIDSKTPDKTEPEWIIPDGRVLSKKDYPKLYATITDLYSKGCGPDVFRVPDLRGRLVNKDEK